ncbi:hypothetical protein AbraIFM66951_005608 [Aspergillus brasiliensis]|nr:hypothetical protein AbraIFM66951_005608 [Aspergillus brasiliensis]
MSLLRYYNKGFGEAALKSHAYNQAVRVGDTIHLSGQDEQAQDAMVRNFRQWMVNHKALWTCVQVGRLGSDEMRVEIEVEAYDPEGAC